MKHTSEGVFALKRLVVSERVKGKTSDEQMFMEMQKMILCHALHLLQDVDEAPACGSCCVLIKHTNLLQPGYRQRR